MFALILTLFIIFVASFAEPSPVGSYIIVGKLEK
jgi:hypothetical protein